MRGKRRQYSDEYCGDQHPRYALMRELRTADCLRGWFRQRVYDRDGGLCQLCGHPVSTFEFHLDHIVLKADGGPYTWSNLRLVHRRCNASRGRGNRPTPAIEAFRAAGYEEKWTQADDDALTYYNMVRAR